MKLDHEKLSSKAWSVWQHHIPPKNFLFKALSSNLSKIFISCSCLFLKGSNKKTKEECDYNFKFHKRRYLWQPSALGCNLTMWPPLMHPSRKAFLPLQFGQEGNRHPHSIERRAYWFILKISRMFPIPSSWNKMIDTYNC